MKFEKLLSFEFFILLLINDNKFISLDIKLLLFSFNKFVIIL